MTNPSVRLLPREDLDDILTRTANLWDEMRGQNIFVTGGSGFFGMWLLGSFCFINDRLGLGAKMTILTRSADAFAAKAPHLMGRDDLTLVIGDVRDFAFPEGVFPFVIHAATPTSDRVEPIEVFDAIVVGTRRILDFAACHGVRKLLLTSSGAVYGRSLPGLRGFSEEELGACDSTDASSAYGEGKRAAELQCVLMAAKYGFEAKLARCFAFVGAHLPLYAHFAIGNFIRDALGGGPIRVRGDGSPVRSYLYAADLAVWLWTILVKGASASPYNVGSEEAVSLGDLARTVGALFGVDIKIGEVDERCARPDNYVPYTGKARRALGLEAWTPLRAAIEKTGRWYGWGGPAHRDRGTGSAGGRSQSR